MRPSPCSTPEPHASRSWRADGSVVVHAWLKQAILLLFKLSQMETVELGPYEFADKIPLKRGYQASGVRVVPGASARVGSYLAPGVVMMPSYVNIGARVGANTMVDTWVTVGSCAQIGENVHLSGGVGIGGVLEPPQAAPVIIGDECLIGSRCIVAEGAVVGEGSVLGAGCILTGSVPGHRRRHGRGAGSRARSRRGRWPSSPPAPAPSPAASSGCRACSSSSASSRASGTTSRRSTRSCAATAPPSDDRRRGQPTRRGAPVRPARAHGRPRRPAVAEPRGGPAGRLARAGAARSSPWLEVTRVADNLVARTEQGHRRRVVLAGHTDTVPPNGNERARVDGDLLWGLGSTDMKGGVAIMLGARPLAARHGRRRDLRVLRRRGGRRGAQRARRSSSASDPIWSPADVALLGEPSDGALEAGCQGTMRLVVTVGGARAHTARPWMGRNAIHRLGHVLADRRGLRAARAADPGLPVTARRSRR